MTDPVPEGLLEKMMAEIDRALVHHQMKQYAEALEIACEQALQGGTCGVLAIWVDSDYRVSVCESVPYGNVYEGHLRGWDALPGFLEAMDTAVAEQPPGL